jgi:hypothetical protein
MKDEEDSLAPIGLVGPDVVRVSAVAPARGTAENAEAAPALAEIAREKFWGRVAVLALGVRL